jgi:hypothetical protein
MRFADANGNMIDVYQATTQMTDESGQSYPYTIDSLLDRATGTQGYYGVFTANMHNDSVQSVGSDAIVGSALDHGIPVVSARQMLAWIDGRNASTFSAMRWNNTTLSFSINVGQGAIGLMTMVPVPAGRTVAGVLMNGSPVSFTVEIVKGVQYARFAAVNGLCEVSFAP